MEEGARDRFDAELAEPLPGFGTGRVSAEVGESETSNLMAFAAQIGGG